MNATEFSKTHKASIDWVRAMGKTPVIVLEIGQKGILGGIPATVLNHYRNCLWEFRVPGGIATCDAKDFKITA